MRIVMAIVLAGFTFCWSGESRADVIGVEVRACVDKKPGDACKACEDWMHATCGTCAIAADRCYPESCWHHATEADCNAHRDDHCRWGPGELTCVGTPCVCEENTGERPSRGVGASCGSWDATSVEAGAVTSTCALILATWLSLRLRGKP